MLRLLTLPFLSLYLFAAAGLQVQLHYCGSELASWALYAAQPGGCEDGDCQDEPQNPDSCCSNEWIETGLVNSYYTHSLEGLDKGKKAQKDSGAEPLPLALPTLRSVTFPSEQRNGLLSVPYRQASPPALYMLHQQFLFYG